MTDDEQPSGSSMEVRPPKQRRSREAWNRVLDAGVGLIEDGGYDAFTIAAVCDRAGVAPPAIYARTATKDALFLAVYEHGMARLRSEQGVFSDESRWAGLEPTELVRGVVREMVGILFRHRRLLRAVVLLSSAHHEVRLRGSHYSQEMGRGFVDLVLGAGPAIKHADAEAAVWSCFDTMFGATIFRVAYGAGFATGSALDDARFADDLAEVATRYLLADPPGR